MEAQTLEQLELELVWLRMMRDGAKFRRDWKEACRYDEQVAQVRTQIIEILKETGDYVDF